MTWIVLAVAIMPQVWASSTTLVLRSGGQEVTSVNAGDFVTLTASVESAGGPVASGQVNFCLAAAAHCTDVNLLGTAQLTGTGIATLTFTPGIGVYSFKAVFAGTQAVSASVSSAAPLTVQGTSPTTTTMAVSGGVGTYSLAATVTGTLSAPTIGSVSFLDTSNGNSVLGSAALGSPITNLALSRSWTSTGDDAYALAVGDFNGDGRLDLAIPNLHSGTLNIRLGNGDGTFATGAVLATASYPTYVATGDFNADGKTDLAIVSVVYNTVTLLLGNGDGTFVTGQTLHTGSAPQTLSVGDFNRDGRADLAVVNYSSNSVNVFLGNGDGTFTAGTDVATGGGPSSLVIGDLNGDGKPDFVVTNYDSSTLTVLLGNGDGTFTAIVPGVVPGGNPNNVALGDFNGDGKLDAAVANYGSKTVSLFLGNGDGTFTATPTLATGNTPYWITVADFSEDGKPDLAVINQNDSKLMVFLGNGDGTFVNTTQVATGYLPMLVATGDFDGDGVPDLVTANDDAGQATVLLTRLTQTATATASGISPIGTGQHAVKASFPGDSENGASVSATQLLGAQPVATTLTLTANPGSSTYGQQVVLSASLQPFAAQDQVTNGEVITFYNGASSLGSAILANGAASVNVTSLTTGTDTLTASYGGDTNFTSSTSGSAAYTVTPLPPPITWATPAAITYGTALNATQLSATSAIPGAFAYNPVAGTVLGAGTQTLTATFIPTDTTNYSTATATTILTVTPLTPAVTWATPASISYGTALTTAQLNAGSSIPGTFSYSPAADTVLDAGTHTLTATFTPTDSSNYRTATAVTAVVVSPATPTVTWANPASISYGTALGAAQLNASSTVPGAFAYNPGAGTVLSAGTQTLTTTFTPTDTTNYSSATTTTTLVVTPLTPSITWAAPASISYGTALTPAQLTASTSIPGTFTYSPVAGTVLSAGSHTLTTIFTPTDSSDYRTATAVTTVVVSPATPTITWNAPASISYGTALSTGQLNASSIVPGTFSYSPAVGTLLGAGPQTLTATFMPADTANYRSITSTIVLTVAKAGSMLSASVPEVRLSHGQSGSLAITVAAATQINLVAALPGGSIVFNLTEGAALIDSGKIQLLDGKAAIPISKTLNAGEYMMTIFYSGDQLYSSSAALGVKIGVGQITPTVSWAQPAAAAYGSSLAAVLNAVCHDGGTIVPGTFAYKAGAATVTSSTVLAAGTYALGVTFTPADQATYSSATSTVTLVIAKDAPTVALTAPPMVIEQTSTTFTAEVSSSISQPSGSVSFFDGSKALGTVALSSGVATLEIVALPVGQHSIMALYGGDANFVSAASAPQSETAQDFSIKVPPSAGSPSPITPGGTVTYALAFDCLGGTSFPAAVSFSVSGLPPGVTAAFNPQRLSPGSGSTATTLTIKRAQQTPVFLGGWGNALFSLPLLLLPFPGFRRQVKLTSDWTATVLILIVSLASVAGLTGCGAGYGFAYAPSTTYTITVTATSATLEHSVNLPLTLQ